MKNRNVYIFLIVIILFSCKNKFTNNETVTTYIKPIDKIVNSNHHGLIGAYYHGANLTRIGEGHKIKSLTQDWGPIRGRGSSWSAMWEGFIKAPADGEVTFYAESNKEFIIEISDEEILHVTDDQLSSSGKMKMGEGDIYSIRVKYLQSSGGEAFFKTYWSWDGKEKESIPSDAIFYNTKQADYWNYIERVEPDTFDFSTLNTIPVENYIVYYEPGRFGGWPANNGAWNWGNEILVGFSKGYHDPNPTGGHAILSDKPSYNVLGRSLDSGKTWSVGDPENFVGDEMDSPENIKTVEGINFAHPDFAMRIRNDRFFITYDRGKNWTGPYQINMESDSVDFGDLTSRTDYIVLGEDECMLFLSAETGLVESNYQDRSFCAKTTDGGKTFQFVGWMTHNTEVRSVMSSTVYLGKDHLVSVVRRKHEETFGERPSIVKNWIETEESKDNGKTWTELGKVAYTGDPERNGNPPAMVKLPDSRLIVAYGYRAFPYGIRIKASSDNGKTWGDEIVLRSDGATWDIGYPRMVNREDGKVVVMYYYTTEEIFEQHISATVFDPADIK